MKKNLNWFTFVELVISITIISLLVMSTYIPYSMQSKKWEMKIISKTLVQNIVRWWEYARNWLAIKNWWGSKNASIWVYLNMDKVDLLSFDFRWENEDDATYFDRIDTSSSLSIVDSLDLNEIEIKEICSGWICFDRWLILFESIYWNTSLHRVNDIWETTLLTWDDMKIVINFKNTIWWPLEREITFDKETRLLNY